MTILPQTQSNQGIRQGASAPMDHMEDLATEETAWLNLTEHDSLAKCLDTLLTDGRTQAQKPARRCSLFLLLRASLCQSAGMAMF